MFHNPTIKKLLLIEDNPGDVRLVQEIIRELDLTVDLQVVTDGLLAMYYLQKKDQYVSSDTPDIIFLDLNIPKNHGYDILKMLKNDTRLKCIPVIVLTISQSEEDILKCYNLHANCYIIKTFDLSHFMENLKITLQYWLHVVTLPNFKEEG